MKDQEENVFKMGENQQKAHILLGMAARYTRESQRLRNEATSLRNEAQRLIQLDQQARIIGGGHGCR